MYQKDYLFDKFESNPLNAYISQNWDDMLLKEMQNSHFSVCKRQPLICLNLSENLHENQSLKVAFWKYCMFKGLQRDSNPQPLSS